jgi:DNA polymerase (family X)
VSDRRQDIVDMLEELAELTVLEEADPQSFRVRAYETAKQAVSGHPGDIASLTERELVKIAGIGKSTAAKIRELLDGGKVQKLEALRAKHPPDILALSRIPGVGPKAVARLRKELGVESVADLKAALAAHKLRDLKGFGQKSEEKLSAALERVERTGTSARTPISVALPLAERLVAGIRELPGVHAADYCGSLRRFSETVGDLDIVVASAEPERVMEHVATLGVVDRVIARGETKTSVVTRRGLQIDVRVVPREALGAARLYFTGSKGHNIKLRQRALARGWTLNEYALAEQETGKVVARETEEEIYAALDLAFIPPVLREDMGEIDLAEKRAIPKFTGAGDVLGDFHVHTDLSGDGRSPLRDMVEGAMARGYRLLAITEHAQDLALTGVGQEALEKQREEIEALQAELGDRIRILHGVELNIGKDGELDYDDAFRASFDYTLASIHEHLDLGRDAQTARVLRAMEDPSVDMIGHLSARMIGGRPPVDLDIDAVLAAAERTKTALEVNGGLPRLDVSLDVMRQAHGRDVLFVLTSDAHQVSELDRMAHACLHAYKGGLSVGRIVNAWDEERFFAWQRDRRASNKRGARSKRG